jgi:hypothetical protein
METWVEVEVKCVRFLEMELPECVLSPRDAGRRRYRVLHTSFGILLRVQDRLLSTPRDNLL